MQCTCSLAHCISKVTVEHNGITVKGLQMALLTPHELQIPPSCLLGVARDRCLGMCFGFVRVATAYAYESWWGLRMALPAAGAVNSRKSFPGGKGHVLRLSRVACVKSAGKKSAFP